MPLLRVPCLSRESIAVVGLEDRVQSVGEREIHGFVEPREVVHALHLLALRPPALQADGADAQTRQVVLVGREAREVAVEDLAADHPLVVVRVGLGTRHERSRACELRIAGAWHHAGRQCLKAARNQCRGK